MAIVGDGIGSGSKTTLTFSVFVMSVIFNVDQRLIKVIKTLST